MMHIWHATSRLMATATNEQEIGVNVIIQRKQSLCSKFGLCWDKTLPQTPIYLVSHPRHVGRGEAEGTVWS